MPETNELLDVITTEEAAEIMRYHLKTVQRLVKQGKLKAVKVGGKVWLILRSSVYEYMATFDTTSKHNPRKG